MNMAFCRIIRFLLLVFFVVLCESFSYTLNIINGNFVNKNIYPTVVLLYDNDYDETSGGATCSGIIVSENVVLTAAHCLLSIQEDYDSDNISYKIKNKGVMVDNVLVKGATSIILPECANDSIQDRSIVQLKIKLDEDYSMFGSISREKYEKEVLALKSKYSGATHDIGALVFDNSYVNNEPPFRSIIEKAKKKGKFFNLSKKVFEDGLIIKDDKKSLFFLGYGLSSSYNHLNDPEDGKQGLTKLQIGYNSVQYSKLKNEWFTPRPMKNMGYKSLYDKSNIASGDSGGPLIYNNKIIGISSYGSLYDCEGNDIYSDPLSDKFLGIDSNGKKLEVDDCLKDACCSKIVYSGSHFSSLSFGSAPSAIESLFKLVKEELVKKDLLKTNSIFSELVE